jgi:hypothetical protein
MIISIRLSPLLFLVACAAGSRQAAPVAPNAGTPSIEENRMHQPNPTIWTDIAEETFAAKNGKVKLVRKYRTLRLDTAALNRVLQEAPSTVSFRDATALISLPLPDGSFARFRFAPAPVMEGHATPGTAAIRTYSGQGVEGEYNGVAFDVTTEGFHALITGEKNAVYIEPYRQNDLLHYICYYKHDLETEGRIPFEEQGPR